uniref:Secreted protein n=1 Tax=Panagrellus redivivus TaxID=6233 RepID=A0A7E4UXK0_PANRE
MLTIFGNLLKFVMFQWVGISEFNHRTDICDRNRHSHIRSGGGIVDHNHIHIRGIHSPTAHQRRQGWRRGGRKAESRSSR